MVVTMQAVGSKAGSAALERSIHRTETFTRVGAPREPATGWVSTRIRVVIHILGCGSKTILRDLVFVNDPMGTRILVLIRTVIYMVRAHILGPLVESLLDAGKIMSHVVLSRPPQRMVSSSIGTITVMMITRWRNGLKVLVRPR